MNEGPLRILLVEDSPADARPFEQTLRDAGAEFRLETADSVAAAVAKAGASAFDAIILDLDLADSAGLETFQRVRSAAEDAPILVLTDTRDDALAVRAVQAGAQDYLVKDDVSPLLVVRAIRYSIERKRAERTLLQTREALRRAQKLEAVGRLAGGIAHDFNNLLTAIIGHTEVMMESVGVDSPLRGELEEVRQAAERATALTRQLLAFSRKEVAVPRVFDVNRRIPELERLFRRLIGARIRIATELRGEALRIRMDPSQFEQVLLNLVVNARDAMPDGGTLTIATAPHAGEDGSPQVAITVRDTGLGMTPEVVERMFEPFFTTKPQGHGTGLGLSTVYGIVHENRGSIDVNSGPAQGTTVHVRLPAVTAAEEPVPVPSEPPASTGPPTDLHVLVVDDEPAVRRLVARILRARGYHVLEAGDAAEALTVAQSVKPPPQLLVTDVTMPGASGHELGRILATYAPGLRVILMSGHTEDEVVRQSVRDDELAFLPKPFTPAQLLRLVSEVLGPASEPS